MTIWLTILGMALVTYATRVTALLTLRGELAPWLQRWLGYVPVAVFVALYLSYSYQSQVFIDWSLIYLPMGSEVRLATAFAAGIGVLVHLPEWMPGLRRAFRRRGRK